MVHTITQNHENKPKTKKTGYTIKNILWSPWLSSSLATKVKLPFLLQLLAMAMINHVQSNAQNNITTLMMSLTNLNGINMEDIPPKAIGKSA